VGGVVRRNPLIVAKDTVALAATHLKAATLQTGEGLLNTVETPINVCQIINELKVPPQNSTKQNS